MLDEKRRGRWVAALSCLFESGSAARYIIAQTLRDKREARLP
jgi:hypothetical protein